MWIGAFPWYSPWNPFGNYLVTRRLGVSYGQELVCVTSL